MIDILEERIARKRATLRRIKGVLEETTDELERRWLQVQIEDLEESIEELRQKIRNL